ncbi:hypothetical protein C6329_RS07920 [Enterococcus faecium]
MEAKNHDHTEQNQSLTSPIQKVKELKESLDMDIITTDEFEKKKKELLGL